MAGNLAQMKQPASGSPPRVDMPQLDQAGGGVDGILSMLDQGQVNFKPAYMKGQQESKASRDDHIMERWNKLAGLIK
jgi:hypothetical protein